MTRTAVAQYVFRVSRPRWRETQPPLYVMQYDDGTLEIHEEVNGLRFVLLTIPASERVEM